MPRAKNETLTLRTTPEIKSLLRQAAEREHRSLASMVEVLVLAYANGHRLKPDGDAPISFVDTILISPTA